MANLRSTYDGKGFAPGYGGIEAQVFQDADKVNGNVLAPDGEDGQYVPRLSNGQVAALVRGWKRAAARSRAPGWPIAYDVTVAALGWSKAGDKFNMTDEHTKAPAPPELLVMFWAATAELAKRLDGSKAKLAPLIVDWSKAGYEQAARDAWQEMQIERGGNAAPTPAPPAVKPAESSGWGGAILLIVLAIAAGKASRKRG